MKKLILGLLVLASFSSNAEIIDFEVETRSPKSVCNNVEELVRLMSPYIEIKLLSCTPQHTSTSFLGNKDFSVEVQVETSAKKCESNKNQAVIFDIPTNTYFHWNPPLRYKYIDHIIEKLNFKSEISVRNLGAIEKPKYKQIVIIPECSLKDSL